MVPIHGDPKPGSLRGPLSHEEAVIVVVEPDPRREGELLVKEVDWRDSLLSTEVEGWKEIRMTGMTGGGTNL
jgi:hypothetical protein